MKIDKIPQQLVKTTEKLVTKKMLLSFFLIGLVTAFLEYKLSSDGGWLLLWLLWIILTIFKQTQA